MVQSHLECRFFSELMLCLQLTINVEEVNKKERENQQHVVCEHRVLYKSIADRFCSTKYRA